MIVLSSTSCLLCDLSPLVVRSLVTLILLSITSGLVVGLRVHTRYKRLKRLSVDDALIILAWIVGVGAGTISHYRDSKGFGDARPSFDELSSIFFQQFAFMHFFYIALALTQISVALNYRRLDGGLDTRHKRLCDCILAYTVIGSTAEILSYILQCIPVTAFWQLMSRDGAKCYNSTQNSILLIYGPPVFRISVDVALIVIPMPIIWKLALPRPQKIAIAAIVCVSFIGIGANLRRLLLTEPDASTSISDFLTNILPRIQVWSNIEIHSAIICACAVTLKAPFAELLKSVQRKFHHGRKASIGSLDEESSMTIPSFVQVTASGLIKSSNEVYAPSRQGSTSTISK